MSFGKLSWKVKLCCITSQSYAYNCAKIKINVNVVSSKCDLFQVAMYFEVKCTLLIPKLKLRSKIKSFGILTVCQNLKVVLVKYENQN